MALDDDEHWLITGGGGGTPVVAGRTYRFTYSLAVVLGVAGLLADLTVLRVRRNARGVVDARTIRDEP